jgi:hypothetical protein
LDESSQLVVANTVGSIAPSNSAAADGMVVKERWTAYVRTFVAYFALIFILLLLAILYIDFVAPSAVGDSIGLLCVGAAALAVLPPVLWMSWLTCSSILVTKDGVVLRPNTPQATLWPWSRITAPESSSFGRALFGYRLLFRLLSTDGRIVNARYFTPRQSQAILAYPGRPKALAPVPKMRLYAQPPR